MADERVAIVCEFLRSAVLGDPSASLSADTRLVHDGLIDSMGIVLLAAFVEERFGVHIPDAEIRDGRLETIATILDFVDGRR